MKITKKEVLNKEFERNDVVVEYLYVNDEMSTFMLYHYDKINNIMIALQFNSYFTLFSTLDMVEIKENEKIEIIKEIAQFKDDWENVMKSEGLDDTRILEANELINEWKEYNNI